jgi:hypothetical protein
MAITFTTTTTRPNTSMPFWQDSDAASIATSKAAMQDLVNSGKLTQTGFIPSDDGLSATNTIVCQDIATLNSYYGVISDLELGKEFNEFFTSHPEVINTRTISGIDSPLTIVTTYTFPGGTSTINVPEIFPTGTHAPEPANLQVLDTSVILTHIYENDAGFNSHHYNDFWQAGRFISLGATKSTVITV